MNMYFRYEESLVWKVKYQNFKKFFLGKVALFTPDMYMYITVTSYLLGIVTTTAAPAVSLFF